MLTVTTPATCAPLVFTQASSVSVGSRNSRLMIGDLDRDGDQDLVSSWYFAGGAVSHSLGNGDGTLAAPSFEMGNGPQDVAVGDLNGDGKEDIAAAVADGNLAYRLGDGAGGFGAKMTIALGGTVQESRRATLTATANWISRP